MNSPDRKTPAIESLGNNPSDELNDATLMRIVQDLYTQTPKEFPDSDQSETGIPSDLTTGMSNASQPFTHGMAQPTKPEMNPIDESSESRIPGVPDIPQATGGMISTGELREEDRGDNGAMPSPNAPEAMMKSPGEMDTTRLPEPMSFESFSPYFTMQQPMSNPPVGPAEMPDSEAEESDRNQSDALQSPYASEGMQQGARSNDNLPGGKQTPSGMNSGTWSAETAEDLGNTNDPSSLPGMPQGESGLPNSTIPAGEQQSSISSSPDNVESFGTYLDVDNLKSRVPGLPDVPQVSGGLIPTGELHAEDAGDIGAMPHAPEAMMRSPDGMEEANAEPKAPMGSDVLDGDMDTTRLPEESDRNQFGALQSPYASEGMQKGVRSSDDLPGGKQTPSGMGTGVSSADAADEVVATNDPSNLLGMPQGESELPNLTIPAGEQESSAPPSPDNVEAYLDVDNLKKITQGFSFDIPDLFPDDDPFSATIRERIDPKHTTIRDRMDPKKDHPRAEGCAQNAGKLVRTALSPAVGAGSSNSNDNEGDAAVDAKEASTDGDYPVKQDFPALNQDVHGKPLIWLDSAATSQKPYEVIEKVREFYHRDNSNVHRGAHALAGRATNAYEEAREKVQAFIKAESKKEIVFVRGTTEAINLVAQSYGRKNVGRGDEILVTEMEHHSNIVPWQLLAQEKGAILKVAPFTDVGELDLEVYERLLNDRTKIVAFTHASNTLGTINPVKQMTEMAHRYGAKVVVDGAQSLPHLPVEVHDIDCDFLAFSGHKLYGPTGIGVLYGKRELLETMPPWQGGGIMIEDVTFEKTVYSDIPSKFEAGTGNIAGAVGLGAAIDYLNKIGMENVARFEQELVQYSMHALGSIPDLRLIGTAPQKAGAISFLIEGIDPVEIGTFLDHEGIAVRAGHHCAQPAVRHYGVESTVRPSLGIYNTKSDIDELVKALYKAIKALK